MKMSVERWWNDTERGNKFWERNLSECHLPTKDLTWTVLGSNVNLRGEISATDRLSHGTANRRVTA
jgi:hypothetical protein